MRSKPFLLIKGCPEEGSVSLLRAQHEVLPSFLLHFFSVLSLLGEACQAPGSQSSGQSSSEFLGIGSPSFYYSPSLCHKAWKTQDLSEKCATRNSRTEALWEQVADVAVRVWILFSWRFKLQRAPGANCHYCLVSTGLWK